MSIVLITSITSPSYDGTNVKVFVQFIVTSNGITPARTDALSVQSEFVVGRNEASIKADIANSVEARANEAGYTIDTYGTPVPAGRAILFPDMTWALI